MMRPGYRFWRRLSCYYAVGSDVGCAATRPARCAKRWKRSNRCIPDQMCCAADALQFVLHGGVCGQCLVLRRKNRDKIGLAEVQKRREIKHTHPQSPYNLCQERGLFQLISPCNVSGTDAASVGTRR
eukprot:3213914-Rhodomonas_salina.2